MKTYQEREQVDGMKGCVKKPIVVHAKQIDEEFRVNTMEGDYKQGKAGDYLMRGIDGELYICDKSIFERTYGWHDPKKKVKRVLVAAAVWLASLSPPRPVTATSPARPASTPEKNFLK